MPTGPTPCCPLTGATLAADHQIVLDHAARQLEKLDQRPPHNVVLLHNQPHEAVSRCTDSDLVVVGGDHLVRAGRCGIVTRAALHQAPCPVLVVHGPGSSSSDLTVTGICATTGRHDITVPTGHPAHHHPIG